MRPTVRFSSLIPGGLAIESTVEAGDAILVTAGATASCARCPLCQVLSRRVHSWYVRHVSDLPCTGRRVRLHLTTRRFRCDEPSCTRRIFAERFKDGVLPARARRTTRLEGIVHHLGLALGGRPGAPGAAWRRSLPVYASSSSCDPSSSGSIAIPQGGPLQRGEDHHRPRPSRACCRQGPLSPAASGARRRGPAGPRNGPTATRPGSARPSSRAPPRRPASARPGAPPPRRSGTPSAWHCCPRSGHRSRRMRRWRRAAGRRWRSRARPRKRPCPRRSRFISPPWLSVRPNRSRNAPCSRS